MVTAPDIRALARFAAEAGDGVRLELHVPRDLHYFQGHFPDCALLPGVVQIGWAIEFGRRYLAIDGECRGISALKFMRVIQPGDAVALSLSFDPGSQQLQFEYSRETGICSSGKAQFLR